MKKRILSALVATAMMIGSVMSVSAAESPNPYYAEGENNSNPIIVTYATGLISSNSISFSRSGRTITITGFTTGSERMKEVGFKSVKVERSSNGSSWTTEANLGDFLSSNAITGVIDVKYTVIGGYYYRVTCTHYAKKDILLFPPTQSISNTTSYVWVG